ncbi:hypothetical protein BSG1_21800 [Bacillus sp. SG-1]|nr:hypothetical protein BSG1_21800 [Bacillus sp. SG-1]
MLNKSMQQQIALIYEKRLIDSFHLFLYNCSVISQCIVLLIGAKHMEKIK